MPTGARRRGYVSTVGVLRWFTHVPGPTLRIDITLVVVVVVVVG